MPKQPHDVSKGTRMLYVWEAVKSLGRASPDRVSKMVAERIGADGESTSLKRNIYRDLKHLADTGEIGVEYFTPNGEKLTPEQESSHKNVRAEYFATKTGGSVPGGGLLAKANAVLVTPKRPMKWGVQKSSNGILTDAYSIQFETAGGECLAVYIPQEDRPFKLIVARNADPGDSNPSIDYLEEKHGLRTAVLYLNEKSMSRMKENERDGHFMIEVRSDSPAMHIRDLNSSTGTLWAPASRNDLKILSEVLSSENTVREENHPLRQSRPWQPLSNKSIQVDDCACLKVGTLALLVSGGEP